MGVLASLGLLRTLYINLGIDRVNLFKKYIVIVKKEEKKFEE